MKVNLVAIMVVAFGLSAPFEGCEAKSIFRGENCKEGMPNGEIVSSLLGNAAESAEYCKNTIKPVVDVSGFVTERTEQAAELTGNVQTGLSKIEGSLDKIISKLKVISPLVKRIPKVGWLVDFGIRVFDNSVKALKKSASQMEKVENVLSGFGTGFGVITDGLETIHAGYEASETGSAMAHALEEAAMTCALKTEGCSDNELLELMNTKIKDTVQKGHDGIRVCEDSIKKTKEVLNEMKGLIGKFEVGGINNAIKKVQNAMAPVLKFYDDIHKVVDEFFSEAKCCVVPQAARQLGEILEKTLDLVSCPADSLLKQFQDSIQDLHATINQEVGLLMFDVLLPIGDKMGKKEVQNLMFTYFSFVKPFSKDAVSCLINEPDLKAVTAKPMDGLKWLVDIGDEGIQSHTFEQILNQVIDHCKDAWHSLHDTIFSKDAECCSLFKGKLKDGEFCDPTNMIPYKHCARCESGKHTFWVAKGHVACGNPPPCIADNNRCLPGTTCNQCCSGKSEFWFSYLHHACGHEPCIGDGQKCLPGTTCNRCCSKKSGYWSTQLHHACGHEPCLASGSKCFAGTSCNKCCSGRNYYKFPNLWSNCK